MNDLRHDPDEGWYTVPDGVKPWGKTVRHVPQPDGTVLTQTNVPPPQGTLTIVAASELWVSAPGTSVTPASGWKIADEPIGATGLAHDCTTWTERTDKRLALLEDAVNRIVDRLTYLLIKLEGAE